MREHRFTVGPADSQCWLDQNDQGVPPFTVMTLEDIETGRFKIDPDTARLEGKSVEEMLEEVKSHLATSKDIDAIWPKTGKV